MDNLILKKVTNNDLPQLQEIGRKTFDETFSADNSKEDMHKYLKEGFSEEQLAVELNNAHSEFYFAVNNKEVIGYLKLNYGPAQTELQDENAVEIERIYVLKEFHGKKVGQMLYEKALQIAREKEAEYVWLGVWEKNLRAINFYKKNGFVEFGKHIFKLGEDEQTDIMIKLRLKG